MEVRQKSPIARGNVIAVRHELTVSPAQWGPKMNQRSVKLRVDSIVDRRAVAAVIIWTLGGFVFSWPLRRANENFGSCQRLGK